MFKCAAREALEFHGEKTELVERMVFQRIHGHLRFAQIAFREAVTVYDEDAVGFQVRDVDLQRRGIHGDQYINGVAGGGHVVGRKMQLEAAYTGERSCRRADLSRVIGKGADVVAVNATVFVNWLPVICMPSPESPAKRITALSITSGLVFEGGSVINVDMIADFLGP